MSVDYQSAADIEQQQWAELEAVVNDFADAAMPFANRGDGNCGAVIALVLEALAARGAYRDRRYLGRAVYVKKTIPQSLRTKVMEHNLYRCVRCGTHIDLTVDHIHPERHGGTLDLSNLQTLCRPCNSSKGAS